MKKTVSIEFLGRDRAELCFTLDGETAEATIESLQIQGSGCASFLAGLKAWRQAILAQPKAQRTLAGIATAIPSATEHVQMLLREAALKANDSFQLPYSDVELCHCRAVPTAVVDRAILSGVKSVAGIARMTSAGTSCGTCKPDSESLIKFRRQT